MKTKNVLPSNKSNSQRFNSRLAAYSATATAALLAAPAADATIQNISTPATYNLPLINSGGSITFDAGPLQCNLYGTLNYQNHSHFSANGGMTLRSGNVLRLPGGTRYAADLAHGQAIAGTNWHFYGQLFEVRKSSTRNGFTSNRFSGQFLPGASHVKTGYIGLKAAKNGQTYYGWLHIKVADNSHGIPDDISLVPVDGIVGAYDTKNDITGDGFATGITATAAPEPSVAALGGLALLACGAAGVREQRRRRQQAGGMK